MGRDKDMYLDFGTPGRKPKKNGFGIGTIGAVLLVVLLAILSGVAAYQWSLRNIQSLPGLPTPTPVTESQTPALSPTKAPTSTPMLTPDSIPVPLPTSPETGLVCTPTPPPTVWDAEYLDNFLDTREKVTVKGAHGGLELTKEKTLHRFLNLADTTELNAVVIDVKADTGRVTYKMNCPAVLEAGTWVGDYKDMPALLKKLKENGIYCIARIVCFKDSAIDNIHPEYMIHKNDGTLYRDSAKDTWINPYCREAWVYLVDIAEQAVRDGFDEICFDYVRFSTDGIIASGNVKDGYTYKVDFGPEAESVSFREIISEFTMYACNRLKPLGAYVSASVYGGIIQSEEDAARVGQSLVDLSAWLDYICPMIYPSHYNKYYAGLENAHKMPYELVSMEVRAAARKLSTLEGHRAILRPWFQGFGYTAEQVREQMTALYEHNHEEWMLWNSGASYVEGAFLLKEEVADAMKEIVSGMLELLLSCIIYVPYVILFVVVLLLFILWFRSKRDRKKEKKNPDEKNQKEHETF